MPIITDMLTVAEAAVVADVEARVVNDALDRGVLPSGFWIANPVRRLAPEGCAMVAFYDTTQDRLTGDERQRVIREVALLITCDRETSETPPPWVSSASWSRRLQRLLDGPLVVWSADRNTSVDFRVFVERAMRGAEDLERAVAMVTEDPEVMGGQPCIRDTGIPVHDVAASVKAGISTEEILVGYPDLAPDDVRLGSLYARARPLRGRPPRAPEVWLGARLSFKGSRPWRRLA